MFLWYGLEHGRVAPFEIHAPRLRTPTDLPILSLSGTFSWRQTLTRLSPRSFLRRAHHRNVCCCEGRPQRPRRSTSPLRECVVRPDGEEMQPQQCVQNGWNSTQHHPRFPGHRRTENRQRGDLQQHHGEAGGPEAVGESHRKRM